MDLGAQMQLSLTLSGHHVMLKLTTATQIPFQLSSGILFSRSIPAIEAGYDLNALSTDAIMGGAPKDADVV